ncbi:MAG TPA: hypothetical protein VNO23_17130 [Candidatus Binatia bacterium]|nr:hypothetical protein [Candidatus Binatia bacterium]
MNAVAGIFNRRQEAERAVAGLMAAGLPRDRISFLTPAGGDRLSDVPTTEAEAPGVGTALGTVAGAATGAAGGIGLGTLVSIAVPGVGPVLAMGILGAALLGAGGAAVGAAWDESMQHGLPRDELYLYEDALRHGRSVVIALAEDAAQAAEARAILDAAGAESLDAARERWWIGLRDAGAHDAAGEGPNFRRGFEAALHPDRRGRPWAAVVEELRARHGEACDDEAFRRGYERGQAWAETTGRGRPSRAA